MRNYFSSIVFFPCLFALISCKGESSSSDLNQQNIEHSYDEISEWEITWKDTFSMLNPHYFVYFYSPTCSHCTRIKDVIIEYALDNESMYFIRFNDEVVVSGDVSGTIGLTSVENLSILGTPALLEVNDKVLETNIAGEKAILDHLNLKINE